MTGPAPEPRMGIVQSTPRRLVEIHEDGTRTEGIVNVVHGPNDAPADEPPARCPSADRSPRPPTEGITVKAPKSAAGVRTVAFPASLVPELAHYLTEYSEAGRAGLVFVGARGGVLRRNNLRRIWLRALDATGLR